jgi:hypothetical protein
VPAALSPDGKVLVERLRIPNSDFGQGAVHVWRHDLRNGKADWTRRRGLYLEYTSYTRAVWSEPLQAVAVSYPGATDGESFRQLVIVTRTRELEYVPLHYNTGPHLQSDPVWLGNQVIFAEGGCKDIEAPDRVWTNLISSYSIPSGRHRILFSGADDYLAPAVSPDQSRLAFAEKREGRWELLIVPAPREPLLAWDSSLPPSQGKMSTAPKIL